MHYATLDDLPDAVKTGLPARAQRIYMGAYNAAQKKLGDKEKSDKTGWAAVKKKFKKQGASWVTKSQSKARLSASFQSLLSDTRRLYQAHFENDGVDQDGRDEVMSLLARVETDPEKFADQLAGLNELATPAMGDLLQYFGERSRSCDHEHDFPGSLDHLIRRVCCAVREQALEYIGDWGYVLAVYPGSVVTCAVEEGYYRSDTDYWRVAWSLGEDGKVTVGDAEPVDVLTVVVPQGAMDGNEDVEIETAKVDPPAIEAAIVPPDANLSLAEESPIAELLLNQDPQWFTPPAWLLQGQPPPGGPDELVQTISCEVTQKKRDAGGIMSISGIATVGNILNHNNQVYPTQVWQDNMPALQGMVEQGSLCGESDHPATKKPSLDRTCLLFDKLWMEGDKLQFEGRVLPTIPSGQNIQILLEAGARVDISSRGRGATKTGTWVNPTTGEKHENVAVIQRGFQCQAFDAVVSGASPGATITEHQTAQQATTSADEEIQMKEIADLTQQVTALAAVVNTLAEAQKAPAAAVAVADPPAVIEQAAAPAPAPIAAAAPSISQESLQALNELLGQQKLMLPILLNNRKGELLEAARKGGMPGQWVNTLRRTIDNANPQTLADLEDVAARALPIIQSQYAEAPGATNGEAWKVEQDAGARPGPKTARQMIEFLVKDLPDTDLSNPFMVDPDSGKRIIAQDRIRTPRRQVRAILMNTAKHQDESWNGPAAIQAFVNAWQGRSEEFIQDAWLDQACADGTTSVAAGGAPTSALFIFPLIRMVYPKLIASEISSIQPIDRPDGRIFFLNALRIVPGMNVVDQAGTTLVDRMFLNRSSSFSSSYADRAAECDEAQKIQLRLASVNVTAVNKALYTINTIEELQDLRAYHGLDVNAELIASASREVAIEWNLTVLEDLVNGATAGTLTFGTVAPVGYTQKEWSEYLPRYIDAASMNIFQKRYGGATHVIAGPNATLKLGAAYRTPVKPEGDNPEIFAGLMITPWMAGSSANLKVYNTAFWAKPGDTNRILVMRRGSDWSDTAHIFAPYIDYVSPILTLPDTFTQKQGIMSRAAHRVVVGDAIAIINIVAGQTGVEL